MVALSLWAIVSQPYAFGAEFGSDALSVGDKTAMSENVPRTDTELLNTLWTAVLDRDAGFKKMLKESGPHELEQVKNLSLLNVLLEGRRQELRPIRSLFHSPNSQLLGELLHQKADRLTSLYRDYRISASDVNRTSANLDALTNVSEENDSGSKSRKIESEYLIRAAQRDLNKARTNAHACRLSLCDLAGEDTIAKLDKRLKFNSGFLDSMDELKAVDQFLHGDRKVLRGYMQSLWLIHQA